MLFMSECLCKWCVYFSAILQAIAFIDTSINKDFIILLLLLCILIVLACWCANLISCTLCINMGYNKIKFTSVSLIYAFRSICT